MRDESHFIIWNGVSSRSKNLAMLNAPDLPTSVRRGNADNTVEYLPGDYWTDFKSFDVIEMSYTFRLKRVGWDKYFDVRGWLQGSGKLTFSDYPNVEYDARVTNLEVAEQPGMKIITVNFVIQPLGMLMPPEPAVSMDMTELTMEMQNLGNMESYPLIRLGGGGTGKGTIYIKRGDVILQSLEIQYLGYLMPGSSETIIMDSSPYVQEAYSEDGTVSKNDRMNGEFLRLPTGHFTIEIVPSTQYDTFTEFTVEPRWCFV